MQLGLFSLSSLTFVPLGLTVCEWFHGRCCWVCSHCLHSHSGPVGLTGSKCFHGGCSWVCSHCIHSHSGLTACEWFHDRCSEVCSHSLHSHSCPICLTGCEWFSWQVQQGLFLLPSLLLWSCFLDSRWAIWWQVQLNLFSLHSLQIWSYCLTGSVWFHSQCSQVCSHCLQPPSSVICIDSELWYVPPIPLSSHNIIFYFLIASK